ncbi:MAG: T9SS type A sorting domain-containing protein, partial [Chitinophagaceae bacterium]
YDSVLGTPRYGEGATGSGTQTFSGGDLLIFRLLTPSSPSTTLNVSLGAGSDMQLANLNGGGLNMQQAAHTLSLNGNTLTMYGAAIFSVTNTGTITGSTTSNLVINKTVGGQPIGSIGFTTGAQQLNNFDYNSSGTGTNNLTLLTPLTVSGNLTMTAGLIIVGANDLAVAGAATGLSTSYVQTNSTGSFILNNVTAARTAPIGNSTYNPLVITNSSSHNWTLRVVDNLNVADPFFASNVLKAVQREWHITPSVNPPASGADIIFQWDDSDPTQIGTSYNPAENVQVWHEIINGSPYGDDWVAAGVSQIATGAPGPGVRTATITGWSWYSPFAVSNISGPLPIKLISFNAVKINDGLAKLNWELAVCCSPDARFEVERSADARNFTVFASVSGSATNRFYLYNDTRLGKGITYYRLKMTDEEGKVSYSKIVAIVNDNSGLVITNVAPNPVSDRALLTLSAGKSGTVSFEVYNLAGAVVKRWTSSLTEGTNIIPVPVGELAAGVYQVQATGQNAKALVRFIKY